MINIFWHRRDLRIYDNAGLYHALNGEHPVQAIFIFDSNILSRLSQKNDARVTFIHDRLKLLQDEYEKNGSQLWVFFGDPIEVWQTLIQKYNILKVYTNEDYESYAIHRDTEVQTLLEDNNIEYYSYKDHVIFNKNEILKKDGNPYVVFTPYKKKWIEKLESRIENGNSYFLKSYPVEKYFSQLHQTDEVHQLKIEDIGFKRSTMTYPSVNVSQQIIKDYNSNRNYPAINGTSKLGIHFRFGTISLREKASRATQLSETYLSELIWRDFYSQILAHYPYVENKAFRSKYEAVEWRNNEDEYMAWCNGKTGYPLVDAGLRELNATGFMHNRVRMIAASFLTKHLLIDWRWGEAYFAEKLLDFELSSNNGGWQWAAGCGTDAAPYFRIFNPMTQQEKFDKHFEYIKKWVPEYGTADYPKVIVDHKMARERCLRVYKNALG